MKYAKDLDLGFIQAEVDKSFYSIIDKMKRKNLDKYIKEGWGKRLNTVQTTISNRLKSCAGRAIWNTSTDKYKIKLHPELPLNDTLENSELKDTINHEVLHLITLKSDTKTFKRICEKLSISMYHSLTFTTKEEYKYKTYCTNCGKLTGKYKRKAGACKNPENYHSNCCKADIKVEKI
ncbi:MAG: SprT-like domain-containing protein [Candidatus Woesearchaeota archaeon]